MPSIGTRTQILEGGVNNLSVLLKYLELYRQTHHIAKSRLLLADGVDFCSNKVQIDLGNLSMKNGFIRESQGNFYSLLPSQNQFGQVCK